MRNKRPKAIIGLMSSPFTENHAIPIAEKNSEEADIP